MVSEIYTAIGNVLKEVKNNQGENVFKHIDLWNNNVDFIQQNSPFELPACFIEFVPFQWNTLSKTTQQADCIVRLHIVTRWIAPTDLNQTAEIFEPAVKDLAIPHFVFEAIHDNVKLPELGYLQRVNSQINHNHEGIVDSLEDYKGSITVTANRTPLATASGIKPQITNI